MSYQHCANCGADVDAIYMMCPECGSLALEEVDGPQPEFPDPSYAVDDSLSWMTDEEWRDELADYGER